MRYYEFTIITNSEKIQENTKVKLKEYSYNGSISAVNEFMYRTLRNGITFCAYREKKNTVSALFCYDERKDTYHDVYQYILELLSNAFGIRKVFLKGLDCTFVKIKCNGCIKIGQHI